VQFAAINGAANLSSREAKNGSGFVDAEIFLAMTFVAFRRRLPGRAGGGGVAQGSAMRKFPVLPLSCARSRSVKFKALRIAKQAVCCGQMMI
jgi:hypothetical protein